MVVDINYLCYECVGDLYLREEIKNNGSVHKCSFCSRKIKSIEFDKLLIKVDAIYRQYYSPDPIGIIPFSYGIDEVDSIGPFGDDPVQIIENMMEVETRIAEVVVHGLSQMEQQEVIQDGAVAYYALGSTYVQNEISTFEYSEIWKELCQIVKHETRFFNQNAIDLLNNIFQGIENYQSTEGKKAIRIIPEENFDRFIYRGRQADDDLTIKRICLSPRKELGPSPKENATAGRMNPAGIPVFLWRF